jgi:cell division protein ZapA (FtsZ GTPase activity inhibitor)
VSEPGASLEAASRNKRLVEIELLGRRFKVRSDDDDAYIAELVDFVNRKLSEVRRASTVVEGEQVALLTLLDVADSLFREKQRVEGMRRKVRERSRKLLGTIDQISEALGTSDPGFAAEALAVTTKQANGS